MNKGKSLLNKKGEKLFEGKRIDGFVYLMRAEVKIGYIYKIGYSENTGKRFKQIRNEYENEITFIHRIKTDHAKVLERIMHKLFYKKCITYCTSKTSEWFKLTNKDVEWFIKFKEFNFKEIESFDKGIKKIYCDYHFKSGSDRKVVGIDKKVNNRRILEIE